MAPKRLTKILCYELPPAKDAVARTAAWTPEGKRACAKLWRIVERMRRIAKRHGEPLVCHGIELARLGNSKRSCRICTMLVV